LAAKCFGGVIRPCNLGKFPLWFASSAVMAEQANQHGSAKAKASKLAERQAREETKLTERLSSVTLEQSDVIAAGANALAGSL
jgi:hypothetical protein